MIVIAVFFSVIMIMLVIVIIAVIMVVPMPTFIARILMMMVLEIAFAMQASELLDASE